MHISNCCVPHTPFMKCKSCLLDSIKLLTMTLSRKPVLLVLFCCLFVVVLFFNISYCPGLWVGFTVLSFYAVL